MKVAELKEWLKNVPDTADVFIEIDDEGWTVPVACLMEDQYMDTPIVWSVVFRKAFKHGN